ncbi:MAG: DUF3604 domain-containing protein [Gammaproteobacteria bacterium]|nr:DUF3604 domain-containing protein [Gammaproteobacteria bacterium]
MLKKIGLGIVVLLLVGIGFIWIKFLLPLQQSADRNGPETAARDYALQDDSRLTLPDPQAAVYQAAPNPDMNLYWGELHLHTAESFDASLFGNTLGVEDAYRFASGEPLTTAGGEVMQLSRPLDFVAITDHAEGFGTRTHCHDANLSLVERAACWLANEPNPMIFQILTGRVRGKAVPGDPSKPAGVYQPVLRQPPRPDSFPTCKFGEDALERCVKNARVDWARYVELADRYNEPGVLTTLIGYEFSPGMPDEGKHHRNIIFRSNTVPDRAISSLDVPNAIELWKGLEATCGEGCEFLTIPHNPNKAWGLMYSRFTWDGKEYTEADWRLRRKREPLAEIFQIKGASECALGVGATDEECAFEQVFDPCEPGETTGCAFQTGFVRQGLEVGLELDQQLGFNPLQVGFIGATDSHNSNPGDVEEWDYRGAVGAVTSSAFRRLRDDGPEGEKAYKSILKFHTSGGLAGVWAPENTREAIFDALARRETYATSGPRMAVRFYAGWGIDEAVANDHNAIQSLMAGGVPMGGVLRPDATKQTSPGFFVWATRDPMDAPLQRVQMVKGWVDTLGKTHEKVVDIACADGLAVDPVTGRCPNNGASVDLRTCSFSAGSGAGELKTLWHDPDYDAAQNAFYYVRVLMNPTCRWSSYDAIRLGREPDPRVPATIQERAWTSPIWLDPMNN